MAKATSLDEKRRALMVECGLDAFSQPAEVWLNIAVAAEERGEEHYSRHCERAMYNANERWRS